MTRNSISSLVIWFHLISGTALCLLIEAGSGDGELTLARYLLYFAMNLMASLVYLLAVLTAMGSSLVGMELVVPSYLLNFFGVVVSNICYEYILVRRWGFRGAIGVKVGLFVLRE